MGCHSTKLQSTVSHKTKVIRNTFETKDQLTDALKSAGLEQCNLLFAIDFTKSNLDQGKKTFGGKSLHYLPNAEVKNPAYEEGENPSSSYTKVNTELKINRSLSFNTTEEIRRSREQMNNLNPYQYVMSIVSNQLDSFDDDGYIPTCIFGHARLPTDNYIKEISDGDPPNDANPYLGCYKTSGVISAYESAIKSHGLSGGTKFTPVLSWAKKFVESGQYHILIIIGDGCIDDINETRQMLKELSNYPISIIFVGVGDGSDTIDDNNSDKWKKMRILDDNPTGSVDNWQSVYLADLKDQLDKSPRPDLELCVNMLMEIPDQYQYFKKANMIK